jgi:hypothetical protein
VQRPTPSDRSTPSRLAIFAVASRLLTSSSRNRSPDDLAPPDSLRSSALRRVDSSVAYRCASRSNAYGRTRKHERFG